MENYLEKMLKMQEELDSFILKRNNTNPTLIDKCVALLVESVEFIEECGYKWWKKPKTNDSSLQSSTKPDNKDKSQSSFMEDRMKTNVLHSCITQGYTPISQSSFTLDGIEKPVGFRDERLKEELIDILHFWLSICNSLGLNSNEIFKIYKKKWEINFERQNDADFNP